ncbi:radical SAM protein [Candidatus Woesearchaeota archaeon]|nr:radical SAM protein [Candidatus Woesearchaeota archaeon]
MNELLQKASKTYSENFKPVAWFGKCIFLSWYCDVGTCKFCYRSTQKSRIRHAKQARRSLPSILVEALIAKHLGWRIEFLTGGYKIFPMQDLIKITKLVSEIYSEKIWLNLGALEEKDLQEFKPYIKGIVASIECINPELHDEICPNKPIKPYEDMFNYAKDLKKSITIVIGLGETIEHVEELFKFIEKHRLERITFYALKPIAGTPYTEGPKREYYAEWIARTRIRFPKLQIIAGITARRVDDVPLLLRAGANAITKFPVTKKFNSDEAKKIEQYIKQEGRTFIGSVTKLPDVNWDNEIEKLDIDNDLKQQTKQTLKLYLERMR